MAAIVSPRAVVLKNLRKQVAANGQTATAAAAGDDDRDTLPLVKLGDMQLHSFFKPSLEAGTYTVAVNQDVDITYNEKDPKTNKNITGRQQLPLSLTGATTAIQTFEVVAPQFSIDPKDIHSTYPPQGHADQPSVLPHIIFNDAHLPWERSAPGITETISDPDEDSIPWLCVFPFDCNGTTPEQQELRLTPDQLNGQYAVYKKFIDDDSAPQVPGAAKPKIQVEMKLSSYFSLPMTVSEYLALADPPTVPDGADATKFTKVRIPQYGNDPDYSEISGLQTPVEVIFLSGKLFKQLFPLNASNKPDVTSFKYLSHVRNVNTEGMVQASAQDAETGLFSILHSKRTGPTDVAQNTPPRPQIVHLISIEYVDQMVGVDTMGDGELVAFISLYRWNYLCQPPLSVNFVDAMRDLGESMKDGKNPDGTDIVRNNLLRCPESILTQARIDYAIAERDTSSLKQEKVTAIKGAMLERLENGYSLVRHRTASGEETVAFNRGPLIPTAPAKLPSKWPFGSNFGQDYQIFDRTLGLMDISYSSAWQIGKLLATSDLGFVAALLRVRSTAHTAGKKTSQAMAAGLSLGMKGKQAVFNSLPTSAAMVKDIASPKPQAASAIPTLRQRWSHTAPLSEEAKASSSSSVNPIIAHAFTSGVRREVASTASAAGNNDAVFDEVALAANPDWAYCHSWIMDKLFLSGLPTHYYVGDSSFLPPESIRFFQIDSNWMDCFIDGAISIANHMAADDDQVRAAIKSQLNNFFSTQYTDKNGEPLHYPQVPSYGFFLRSAVVTVFPDLTLDIPYPDDDTRAGRAPILLQKHLGKDVLLVLLDRPPEDLVKIKISQPPHQQRFSAGDNLDETSLDFLFREVYKQAKADGTLQDDFFHEFGPLHRLNNPKNPPPVSTDPGHVDAATEVTTESLYDWTTRCLDMPTLDKYLLGSNGVYSNATDTSMKAQWGPNADGSYQKLSSAMTGLTLNDTIKYLEIKGLNYDGTRKTPQQAYWIRVKEPQVQLKAVAKQLASMKSTVPTAKSLMATVPSTPLPAVSLKSPIATPSTSLRAQALTHSTTPRHLTRLAPLSDDPKFKPLVIRAAASPMGGGAMSSFGAGAAGPSVSGTGLGASGPTSKVQYPLPVLTSVGAKDRSFKYAIFPSTSKFVPAPPTNLNSNSYVFIDTPYVPDLVFSININPVSTNPVDVVEKGVHVKRSFYLREVQFKIPIGDAKSRTDPADIPGVGLVPANASAGLRGRMLDNQRWVIHLDPSAKYMVVRIIPRSTKMSTPVEWNRNLSFKLMEVDVAGIDVGQVNPPTGLVEIRISELYGWLMDDGKTWVDQGRANSTWKVMRRVGFASGWRPDAPK